MRQEWSIFESNFIVSAIATVDDICEELQTRVVECQIDDHDSWQLMTRMEERVDREDKEELEVIESAKTEQLFIKEKIIVRGRGGHQVMLDVLQEGEEERES